MKWAKKFNQKVESIVESGLFLAIGTIFSAVFLLACIVLAVVSFPLFHIL